MGDWDEPADPHAAPAGPTGWCAPRRSRPADVSELAEMIERARSPALVVGPGADSCEGWEGVKALAERLGCPVWQESFTRRAGFPQDHPLFAGHLPWRRELMRDALAPHDLAIAIGTNAFRLYLFDDPGPMVADGTRVAVLTDDPAEAHRSPCELAVVAPVAAACSALAEQVVQRDGRPAGAVRPAAGWRHRPRPASR